MSMQFSRFTWYADTIDAVEGEGSEDEKISHLADAFQDAGDDLRVAARFFQGEVFPAWDGRKMSIGPSLMYKSLAKAAGSNKDHVEDIVASVGGAGLACEELEFSSDEGQQTFGSIGDDSPSLNRVYNRFEEISQMSGAGSQAQKTDAISDLLQSTTDANIHGDTVTASAQAKYLTRLVLSEMRIGVGSGTVRDAIARAFDVPVPSVKRALMVTADAGAVAETARDDGADGLDEMGLTVGRPVEAMLASKGTIDDAVEKWDEAVAEVKYDGARLQLHKDSNDEVSLFTRGLEDETESLPDVVDIVLEHVDADEVILDAEVVAYESEDDDDPLQFTEIMKRLGRKHDVDEKRAEISVNVHVFDVLYKDGETLITKPLSERQEHLDDTCPELASTRIVSDDAREIAEFEAQALADGHEGIMLKNPASVFDSGKRGQNWLKVKPDIETLDCVVVGGEMGEGRRQGVIGSYLLAVRGDDDDLNTIGKVATGLTDEKLAALDDRFEPLIKSQQGKEVTIQAEVVFEVGYEEIYASPEYTSGYGLRFPRFLGVREDKRVSDADSVERVENLLDQ